MTVCARFVLEACGELTSVAMAAFIALGIAALDTYECKRCCQWLAYAAFSGWQALPSVAFPSARDTLAHKQRARAYKTAIPHPSRPQACGTPARHAGHEMLVVQRAPLRLQRLRGQRHEDNTRLWPPSHTATRGQYDYDHLMAVGTAIAQGQTTRWCRWSLVGAQPINVRAHADAVARPADTEAHRERFYGVVCIGIRVAWASVVRHHSYQHAHMIAAAESWCARRRNPLEIS